MLASEERLTIGLDVLRGYLSSLRVRRDLRGLDVLRRLLIELASEERLTIGLDVLRRLPIVLASVTIGLDVLRRLLIELASEARLTILRSRLDVLRRLPIASACE